jgi:sarcosine oxidase subunit beta
MTEVPAHADVVVVGAGVMGASIAYHLALRGATVVLLERGAVCCGTTRHSTAIIRLHYSHALLVRMALHGLRTYRAFEDVVGSSSGFTRTGMLFAAGRHDAELLERNVALGRAEGVETHLLDEGELADLDPRFDAKGLALCYEPEAGYADPYLATTGFAEAARRLGTTVLEGVAVTEVRDGRVETDVGAVEADMVVVAAGVWSGALLAPLGYELPVRPARAEVGRYRLPAAFGVHPPALADFSGEQVYFRPAAERGVLEVGSLDASHAGESADLSRGAEAAEPLTLEVYERAIHRRLPSARGGHWRGAWTGIYDVTPDWEPAIGRVPDNEGVLVAAGFSGHGFKLAPAVGLAVAELALDGSSTTFDLAPLDPLRWERGDLLPARYGYSVMG